jgi:hypothetical protein
MKCTACGSEMMCVSVCEGVFAEDVLGDDVRCTGELCYLNDNKCSKCDACAYDTIVNIKEYRCPECDSVIQHTY